MNKKSLALLVALMIALTSTLCAAEQVTEAPAEEPIAETIEETVTEEFSADTMLCVFGTHTITKGDCDELIAYYADQGYTFTYTNAVDYFKYEAILEDYSASNGFDQFTEEEEAELTKEAEEIWDEALESYVSYYLTEDTEEARAQLKESAVQYYTGLGYSVKYLVGALKNEKENERVEDALISTIITDDDIAAYYESQYVAADKAQIGDSAMMYEIYSYYYSTPCYIPAGFRNVIHILMVPDETLLNAYTAASESYEALAELFDEQEAEAAAAAETAETETAVEGTEAAETETAEAEVTEEPITEAQVAEAKKAMEDAKAAVIVSKQAEIDDIEARLAADEDFKTLIAQYGEDPGQDVNVGYNIHKESIMWDPAFVEGGFDEKMQQPGDHSNPVVGSYGIHILYYVADVPEGAAPLTDEMRESIREEILNMQYSDAANELYAEMLPEYEVTEYSDIIAKLDAAN